MCYLYVNIIKKVCANELLEIFYQLNNKLIRNGRKCARIIHGIQKPHDNKAQ